MESECPQQQVLAEQEVPVGIALPFKDQTSAHTVHRQLSDLSRKTNPDVCPIYASGMIKDEIKVKEKKPPANNQQ